MRAIFYLIILISLSACADTQEKQFEKFFNSKMPVIQDDGTIFIYPKDSDVLPVTNDYAMIRVHIQTKGLSQLLILHGKNKYPDKVCKSKNKKVFVAAYNFNPDDNVSQNTSRLRVDCSSNIIAWAKTINGKFYKTIKPMRVFHFHKNQ